MREINRFIGQFEYLELYSYCSLHIPFFAFLLILCSGCARRVCTWSQSQAQGRLHQPLQVPTHPHRERDQCYQVLDHLQGQCQAQSIKYFKISKVQFQVQISM